MKPVPMMLPPLADRPFHSDPWQLFFSCVLIVFGNKACVDCGEMVAQSRTGRRAAEPPQFGNSGRNVCHRLPPTAQGLAIHGSSSQLPKSCKLCYKATLLA